MNACIVLEPGTYHICENCVKFTQIGDIGHCSMGHTPEYRHVTINRRMWFIPADQCRLNPDHFRIQVIQIQPAEPEQSPVKRFIESLKF